MGLAAMPVHHRAMTVLIVVGSLLAVLAVACWWEARRGKPAWGSHMGPGGAHDARGEGEGGGAWPGGGGMDGGGNGV